MLNMIINIIKNYFYNSCKMKINKTIILLISLILFISSNAKTNSKLSKSLAKRSSNRRAETKILKRNRSKYSEETGTRDSNRGSVFSLVDLEVNCFKKKGPLTKFHLYGLNGWFSNDIGYEFSCMNDMIKQGQTIKSSTVTSKKVSLFDYTTSPKLLNNLEVNCGEAFISSFVLKRGINDLHYTSSCISLKQKAGSCENKKTPEANVAWIGLFSDTVSNLDQLSIEAPANKALVSFKLVVQNKKVLYEYKVCEIDTSVPVIIPETSKIKGRNVDNINFKLDRRRRY